jgi:hypothetical protein
LYCKEDAHDIGVSLVLYVLVVQAYLDSMLAREDSYIVTWHARAFKVDPTACTFKGGSHADELLNNTVC